MSWINVVYRIWPILAGAYAYWSICAAREGEGKRRTVFTILSVLTAALIAKCALYLWY